MGSERPFTGAYWDMRDVGMYNCIVCSQRLFSFDHKYLKGGSKTGYPTFWNSMTDAVKLRDDNLKQKDHDNHVTDASLMFKEPIKRCVCSNCEAHLGHIFLDGPQPLGLRFHINSAALNFEPKPWFEMPRLDKGRARKIRKQVVKSLEGQEEFYKLIKEEEVLGLGSYKERQLAKQKAKEV